MKRGSVDEISDIQPSAPVFRLVGKDLQRLAYKKEKLFCRDVNMNFEYDWAVLPARFD